MNFFSSPNEHNEKEGNERKQNNKGKNKNKMSKNEHKHFIEREKQTKQKRIYAQT